MKDKFETLSEALEHVLEITEGQDYSIKVCGDSIYLTLFRYCESCGQHKTSIEYVFGLEGGRKL